MPSYSSGESSRQHRAQLFWTGLVAIILGIVALQQAVDPSSASRALSSTSTSSSDSVLTGNPMNDLRRNPATSE